MVPEKTAITCCIMDRVSYQNFDTSRARHQTAFIRFIRNSRIFKFFGHVSRLDTDFVERIVVKDEKKAPDRKITHAQCMGDLPI